MVAVCLQTCDRFDLTVRTVESFAAHNDLTKFLLLHADDASTDDRIGPLVRSYGFQTVVQTKKRRGVMNVRRQLIHKANERKARWVLLLENDIETLQPFPWDLFKRVTEKRNIYCLRLYGAYKDAEQQQPCLTYHKSMKKRPVVWHRFRGTSVPSQIGVIHWSAQPAVTRMRELLRHHRTGVESPCYTVRVVDNVMAHIGYERTPGRIV